MTQWQQPAPAVDPAVLERLAARARRRGYLTSVIGLAAGYFAAWWLLARHDTEMRIDPALLVPAAAGAAVGALVRARRERSASPSDRPLIGGLAIRQQFQVWVAVCRGQPGTDPLQRVVGLVTARRAIARAVREAVSAAVLCTALVVMAFVLPAPQRVHVLALVLLIAAAGLFAAQRLVLRGASEYVARVGPPDPLPVLPAPMRPESRLRALWTPVLAAHRVWLRRAALSFGMLVICGGGGLLTLVASSALAPHFNTLALWVFMPGLVLFVLAMPVEILIAVCLLAAVWTFIQARISRHRGGLAGA